MLAPQVSEHSTHDAWQGTPDTTSLRFELNGACLPVLEAGSKHFEYCWGRLPDAGKLVMDFKTVMEACHVKLFSDAQLEPLIPQFEKKMMIDRDKLDLAIMVCPHYYFTCQQAARILVNFGIGDHRVVATSLFISRVIDLEENKNKLLDLLDKRDVVELKSILQYYSTFSPQNPTGWLICAQM